MGKSRAPASGEQSAISGYFKQYEYSACKIFECMRDGSLQAISLANKEAGILDDLLISANNLVHATQIKSSKDSASVSLHTELIANGLISEIAKSWKALEACYGLGKVRVHYIFAGHFSHQDRKLNPNPAETRIVSSAAFADFINSSDKSERTIEKSQWSDTIKQLKDASGLNGDFQRFLNCLTMGDERDLTRHQIQTYSPSDRRFPTELMNKLPQLIRENAGATWSEIDLIKHLGWPAPLTQRNFHEFPIPPDFQDNDQTEQELLAALSLHERGYLALIGPPGSGKSTLLQRTLVSSPDFGVVRYLAYVPDSRQGLGRAEPTAFLNDISVQLANSGLPKSRFADDLVTQRTEFLQQLNAASARFKQTGRKTVIIVDGLDHVPREEKVAVSFISELPSTDSIPAGVLIVLGTQHIEFSELRATIRQQASTDDRKITIKPLSKAAIYAIADGASLNSVVDRETLYNATAGHPLAARYFIEALKGITDADVAGKLLSHSEGLGRSLEEIYERVWSALKPDNASQKVLALLARAEKTILPKELAVAVDEDAVENVLNRAGFLLQRSPDNRVSIFHNSFRLYVASETSKSFGQPDDAKERKYQSQLAEIAARVPASDPQHWLRIRYLHRAGDLQSILAIATPEYFRKSLQDFRPSGDIFIDLRFAFGAVKPTNDRTKLVHYLLLSKEIEYRLEAVSEFDAVATFLTLGEIDRAVECAIDGEYNGNGWIELVDRLWADGQYEHARAVFEANEPLDVLFNEQRLHQMNEMDEVHDWIYRAHRFRPLDRLVALIDGLDDKAGAPIGGANYSFRKEMSFHLARGYVNDHPEIDIRSLCKKLSLADTDADIFEIETARCVSDDLAKGRLANIPMARLALLPAWCRRLAARKFEKLGQREAARKVASDIEIPSLSRTGHNYASGSYIAICRELFALETLSVRLGLKLQKEKSESDEFQQKVEDRILQLAAARATLGKIADQALIKLLREVAQFLARAQPIDRHSSSGFMLPRSLAWFADVMIGLAEEKGSAVLAEFISTVDRLIEDRGNRLASSEPFRLRIATSLFDCNGDAISAKARIDATLLLADFGRTPQEVVDSYKQCALAYSHIGLQEEANSCLSAMHAHTLGYWLRAKKEPQYDFWIDAYRGGCSAEPHNVSTFGKEFGRFLIGMDQTEGDGTAQRVVRDLLLGAAPSPPTVAALISRLFETDLTSWCGVIGAVLEGIVTHRPDLSAPCMVIFDELVVPFSRGGEYEFVGPATSALEAKERVRGVGGLLESIDIWCAPSGRRTLLEEIAVDDEILKEAVTESLERSKAFSEILADRSASGLESNVEIGKEFASAATLAQLAQLGDGKSEYGRDVDYSYSHAATRLLKSASAAEVTSFIEAVPLITSDARFMTAAAEQAFRRGELALSKVYFSDAQRSSRNGHWSQFLGGEKLDLQRLRCEIYGEQGREQGWGILLEELEAGRTFGATLFLNLTDVLESISTALPWADIWRETQRYLAEYREYRLAEEIEANQEVANEECLLAFVLALSFDLNCQTVLSHARRAAGAAASLDGGQAILPMLVKQLARTAGGSREVASLLYRLRERSNLHHVLSEALANCEPSGDFIVEEQLRRVRTELGLPDLAIGTDMPAFYELSLAGVTEADDFEAPPGLGSGVQPLWTGDPWTWTSTLETPLKMLQRATPIGLEMLRRRCATFMEAEGGRGAFGPEAEKQLRAKLERLDLKCTFWRLMPFAAQRALGKVIEELWLAGQIDEGVLPHVWSEIGGPSLSGHRLPTERQPGWLAIGRTPAKQYGGFDGDMWLGLGEELLYVPLVPDMVLLAEMSHFRLRAWRENFTSVRLSLPEIAMRDSVDEEMWGFKRLSSLDDFYPLYQPADSQIVCTVSDLFYGELREPTITLCPYLMRHLGWGRSDDPFEIIDSQGQVVAKTIRWQNGTDILGWSETELYGEGQALVVSPDAFRELERVVRVAPIRRKVIQRVEPEGKKVNERIFTD